MGATCCSRPHQFHTITTWPPPSLFALEPASGAASTYTYLAPIWPANILSSRGQRHLEASSNSITRPPVFALCCDQLPAGR